jgi:hypothetical protein
MEYDACSLKNKYPVESLSRTTPRFKPEADG